MSDDDGVIDEDDNAAREAELLAWLDEFCETVDDPFTLGRLRAIAEEMRRLRAEIWEWWALIGRCHDFDAKDGDPDVCGYCHVARDVHDDVWNDDAPRPVRDGGRRKPHQSGTNDAEHSGPGFVSDQDATSDPGFVAGDDASGEDASAKSRVPADVVTSGDGTIVCARFRWEDR